MAPRSLIVCSQAPFPYHTRSVPQLGFGHFGSLKKGLDHGVGHFQLPSLRHGALRRTERCWRYGDRFQNGPMGGNVRPAAISSNALFDNMLVAHCTVDDCSAEFPKT